MLTLTPEQIKEILFTEAPGIFKNQPVLFSYLYGSYAIGVVHPFSDIDIAIFVEDHAIQEGLELELTLSLQLDQKLNCQAKSEVRIVNTLPLTVKGKIVTEGIRIYSADEIERVIFEKCVLGAYFDFRPVIEAYQRTYFKTELSE
ncbi:MAG: nucleotidyltransferase domain-containing protein [Desulfobacterales bacterium]|nr:MAG: nucleotidyltransferase domain-containing protein [Desulfobacterales bacterium]